ncbi:MAG: hypothetical protein JSS58_00155 [Proteobacteria bacterium]|nr:hypothetical protein [Pseudomonadota bacterium]
MDLPQCPHCYAPIMAQPDGTCPACRKNTLEAPPENRKYVAVEISADQTLPPCCMLCGRDTRRIEHFEFRYDSHLGGELDEQAYLAFVLLTLCTCGISLLLLPHYRRYLNKRREMVYHIALPLCDACLPKKSRYRPLTIEGTAYHFKVHRDFRDRLAAIAPPKPTLA